MILITVQGTACLQCSVLRTVTPKLKNFLYTSTNKQHQWIYATHYKRVALAEFKVSFRVSHKAVFSHVLMYFLLDRLLQKMLLGETFLLNNEK